jgi:ABC-type sulfate/molybdate transport systems ATPase subunit
LLVCRFHRRLPDFELCFDAGVGAETLALVGRSGSGKSTTLGIIAGLMRPDGGIVRLGDRTLVDVAAGTFEPPERRRIGYLLQGYALFPHMTVAQNVAFGLFGLAPTDRKRRVAEALEFLHMTSLAGVHPAQLSGGERQRAALARAVATRPAALLLDEPLAALDVEIRSRLRTELRALLRELRTPVIVVTHDFDDARVLGDRIAALDRGRIVQIGSPAELIAYPADQFVAALTGTNLAAAADGRASRVAFDPWAAAISRTAGGSPYEWPGTIVDMQPLGAQVRISVRGATLMRVDVGAALSEGFGVGDRVFVSALPMDARRIPDPGEETRNG